MPSKQLPKNNNTNIATPFFSLVKPLARAEIPAPWLDSGCHMGDPCVLIGGDGSGNKGRTAELFRAFKFSRTLAYAADYTEFKIHLLV